VAEWLGPLFRFRYVPGSNLVPENGCRDQSLSCFFLVAAIKTRRQYLKFGQEHMDTVKAIVALM
jgi:hypothetical protein